MTAQTVRDIATEDRNRWADMSRADRLMNGRLLGVEADGMKCNDGNDHGWLPVSFVFETQLLDHQGRVQIRQPDINEGRVYLVCLGCNSHTYVVTEWVGYFLGGPGDGTAGPDPVLSLWPDPDEPEEPEAAEEAR